MFGEQQRPLRSVVRSLINILFVCLTLPFWGSVRLSAWLSESIADRWFATAGQALSLIPGAVGVWARRAFYRKTLQTCGSDLSIGFLSWIAHRTSRVGQNVYVGAQCVLGTVELDDNILVGTNVQILSGRHQHLSSQAASPLAEQVGQYRRTAVGGNVWIGNSAVVMADIGKDCIVGAGSVVVHAVPNNRVVAGNPARMIRQLCEEKNEQTLDVTNEPPRGL